MLASSLAFNSLLLISCLVMGLVLVRSRMLRNDLWKATLTPLSFIIGSGLLQENSRGRLSTRIGYVSISVCSILLVWAVDLLEIITLASRAFATYYFLQALLAIFYNYKDSPPMARVTLANEILFVTLAIILAYVIVFSIPAG